MKFDTMNNASFYFKHSETKKNCQPILKRIFIICLSTVFNSPFTIYHLPSTIIYHLYLHLPTTILQSIYSLPSTITHGHLLQVGWAIFVGRMGTFCRSDGQFLQVGRAFFVGQMGIFCRSDVHFLQVEWPILQGAGRKSARGGWIFFLYLSECRGLV